MESHKVDPLTFFLGYNITIVQIRLPKKIFSKGESYGINHGIYNPTNIRLTFIANHNFISMVPLV
jgi:hypothetical protein